MSCRMSGGVESVTGDMFVEVGYHGVKLPAKLYWVHIRRWLEKCCFQYCDLQIASVMNATLLGCKAAGRTEHQWCTTLPIFERHILTLHSVMDMHAMQHLYIVRKSIRATFIWFYFIFTDYITQKSWPRVYLPSHHQFQTARNLSSWAFWEQLPSFLGISTTAWSCTSDDMIIGVALLPLHWLKATEEVNEQHNMSMSSHTSWTYFPERPESDDKLSCCVMRIPASSCVEKRSCQSILTPPAISTVTSLTRAIIVRVLPFCIDVHHVVVPIWGFYTSMTSYILLFMLVRMTCVHVTCMWRFRCLRWISGKYWIHHIFRYGVVVAIYAPLTDRGRDVFSYISVKCLYPLQVVPVPGWQPGRTLGIV